MTSTHATLKQIGGQRLSHELNVAQHTVLIKVLTYKRQLGMLNGIKSNFLSFIL